VAGLPSSSGNLPLPRRELFVQVGRLFCGAIYRVPLPWEQQLGGRTQCGTTVSPQQVTLGRLAEAAKARWRQCRVSLEGKAEGQLELV
jgi:hypothetical protein